VAEKLTEAESEPSGVGGERARSASSAGESANFRSLPRDLPCTTVRISRLGCARVDGGWSACEPAVASVGAWLMAGAFGLKAWSASAAAGADEGNGSEDVVAVVAGEEDEEDEENEADVEIRDGAGERLSVRIGSEVVAIPCGAGLRG
jgi:hypothetical protein